MLDGQMKARRASHTSLSLHHPISFPLGIIGTGVPDAPESEKAEVVLRMRPNDGDYCNPDSTLESISTLKSLL